MSDSEKDKLTNDHPSLDQDRPPLSVEQAKERLEYAIKDTETWVTGGFLDVASIDREIPGFWGDAILLRDDDGMGFSLNDLKKLRGKEIVITIAVAPEQRKQFWCDTEPTHLSDGDASPDAPKRPLCERCPNPLLSGHECAQKRGLKSGKTGVEFGMCICACHSEVGQITAVLKSACDRNWKDETPLQVAQIAANAIYWRDREIATLRGSLRDASHHVSDTLSVLLALRASRMGVEGD